VVMTNNLMSILTAAVMTFLLTNPEVNITRVPSTKPQKDFYEF